MGKSRLANVVEILKESDENGANEKIE